MAVKEVVEIEVKSEQAKAAVSELKNSVDSTKKTTEDFGKLSSDVMGKLDSMTGGLITGFRKLTTGVKLGIRSMSGLKLAIASTGIGALVIAFGSLVSFFTKTQRGADKINQVFKGLGAVVDVLIDRVSSFGEGLFKIVSGDFEEGFNILKESISGVGEEIKKEGAAALQLEKDMQALEDREIKFIKVQAQKKRAIESARLSAEDESKSDKERAAALQEAIRIQNELTDEQIEIEKERARIIKERVKLGESTREDLEEQALAEARVIELETERDRRLRSVQTRLNAFTEGTKDSTKAKEKEANATKKQAEKQEELNKQREKELRLLVEKSKQAALDEQLSLLQQAENLENAFFEKRLDREDAEKNAIRDKYFAVIEAAKEAGRDITVLKEAEQSEIAAVEKKYAGQRIEAYELAERARIKSLDSEEQQLQQTQALEQELYNRRRDLLSAQIEQQAEGTAARAELMNELNLLDAEFNAGEMQRAKEVSDFKKTAAEEETAKREEEAEKQKQIEEAKQQAILGVAAGALNAAAGFAEEGSDLAKGIAVAQATIGGIESTIQAYKSVVGIPVVGPVLAPIAAGVAAATTAASIRDIINVDPSGNTTPSTSSAGRSSGATVANNIGAPQFNTLAAVQQNRLLGDISSGVNQPQRAYVVSGDVTTAQELNRKRIKNASF